MGIFTNELKKKLKEIESSSLKYKELEQFSMLMAETIDLILEERDKKGKYVLKHVSGKYFEKMDITFWAEEPVLTDSVTPARKFESRGRAEEFLEILNKEFEIEKI